MIVWGVVNMVIILLILVSIMIYYILRWDYFFPND